MISDRENIDHQRNPSQGRSIERPLGGITWIIVVTRRIPSININDSTTLADDDESDE
jgi:hypothetical protein